jgi:hypothetical protein
MDRFSTSEVPIEVREKANHLWRSIKDLVEVKPEDEPQVVVRIGLCLMMYTIGEDLNEHIRQSPVYQRMVEQMKKRFEQGTEGLDEDLPA